MTTATGQRLDIAKLAPEVYKAMIALDAAARKGLEPTLVELVLTRASQLNHCAWCLDMHTRDARKVGVTEQKLYSEAAGEFSDVELAQLISVILTINAWNRIAVTTRKAPPVRD
jgi:AhpD family alkylhydroperoxidase